MKEKVIVYKNFCPACGGAKFEQVEGGLRCTACGRVSTLEQLAERTLKGREKGGEAT